MQCNCRCTVVLHICHCLQASTRCLHLSLHAPEFTLYASDGGISEMNIGIPPLVCQCKHPHWSMGTFHEQWTLALGAAVEQSTAHTYTSTATSYITFCNLHNFPTEPTVERLCLYIVYMSHHIKPTSVKLYLSGICAKLEPFYPDVHAIRSSKLVNRTLTGCTKLYGCPANRKCVLTESNLLLIICSTLHHTSHDDLLFNAIVLMGWHCLLRLGELIDHNSTSL